MMHILALPDRLLADVIGHLRDVPKDRRRQFLDTVARLTDPNLDHPDYDTELGIEVISACHRARHYMGIKHGGA
jgi:hypothetical protein